MPSVIGSGGASDASIVWSRSSRCHTANCCVEVSRTGKNVLLRSSVTPEKGHLAFSTTSWHAFIEGIRAGEFDYEIESTDT